MEYREYMSVRKTFVIGISAANQKIEKRRGISSIYSLIFGGASSSKEVKVSISVTAIHTECVRYCFLPINKMHLV